MSDPFSPASLPADPWVSRFGQHLATDRGAAVYTQRNYRHALLEFQRWYHNERQQSPVWDKLSRDDFRAYLRFLGRHDLSRAAVQLRFSALRSFYGFLIRRGALPVSPIKNLALPKAGRRLPRFLTSRQMADLLAAPLRLLESGKDGGCGAQNAGVPSTRDFLRYKIPSRPEAGSGE